MQNNKIDMDKICEGCISYEQHIEDPEYHALCEGYKRKHIRCPCQNCLIKIMCDDVCEEYKIEWGDFLRCRIPLMTIYIN